MVGEFSTFLKETKPGDILDVRRCASKSSVMGNITKKFGMHMLTAYLQEGECN